MLTIIVTDDNELITTSKERIMQRSKCVDKVHFLVNPLYKELDISNFTVMLEYLLPVSKEYHSEILIKSEELYKDKLEYTLPFDTSLTKEAGNIEVQLTFTNVDLDKNGNNVQYVRKTSTENITIVPISAWSDIIPDSSLNAIDQALLMVEAKIKELEDISEVYDQTKADNIKLNDDGDLQLTSKGTLIGNAISVAIPGTEDDEDNTRNGIIDADEIYETIKI